MNEINTPESESNTPNSSPSLKIGLEEFLEDVFGLNIRSAKTIWELFKTPSLYFKAAQTPHWQQKYTPSLRLWMGLMAIMVALQFFWANPDGAFMQLMKDQLIDGLKHGIESNGREATILEDIDFDAILLSTMKINTLIYPFIFITLMSLLALIYCAWGQKLPYVVRQRYIFSVIIPGTVVGIISTILMTFLSGENYQSISFLVLFIIIGSYFITAYRGPYAYMEIGEKFGRSLFLSLCIILTLMLAQFISYTAAIYTTLLPALSSQLGAGA